MSEENNGNMVWSGDLPSEDDWYDHEDEFNLNLKRLRSFVKNKINLSYINENKNHNKQ